MPFPEISIGPEVLLVIQVVLAFLAAYLLALWFSLVIWTFMDIRSRSRDFFAHVFAALLVLVLGLPGLLLYLILRPQETLAEQYRRSLEEEAILEDLEKQLACPTCKRAVQSDFRICPYCQTQLKQACQQCGQPLNAQWKACPYCATPVAVETPRAQPLGVSVGGAAPKPAQEGLPAQEATSRAE